MSKASLEAFQEGADRTAEAWEAELAKVPNLRQVELKWWEDLWKFWIEPGNDDVEMEQLIKDAIDRLKKS